MKSSRRTSTATLHAPQSTSLATHFASQNRTEQTKGIRTEQNVIFKQGVRHSFGDARRVVTGSAGVTTLKARPVGRLRGHLVHRVVSDPRLRGKGTPDLDPNTTYGQSAVFLRFGIYKSPNKTQASKPFLRASPTELGAAQQPISGRRVGTLGS